MHAPRGPRKPREQGGSKLRGSSWNHAPDSRKQARRHTTPPKRELRPRYHPRQGPANGGPPIFPHRDRAFHASTRGIFGRPAAPLVRVTWESRLKVNQTAAI